MPRGPGRRMMTSLAYIAANPGCSKTDAARCGKDGPLHPGSVTALLRRGLAAGKVAGRYRLHATPAGLALLAAFAAQRGGTLADGEPALLLRATDALACPAVSAYYELCLKHAASPAYLAQVQAAYNMLAGWQEANPGKVALPGRGQQS